MTSEILQTASFGEMRIEQLDLFFLTDDLREMTKQTLRVDQLVLHKVNFLKNVVELHAGLDPFCGLESGFRNPFGRGITAT